MALQGEAKRLYHREYMRRRGAGLPTRGVVKPKVMEQWCSECVLPPLFAGVRAGFAAVGGWVPSGRSTVGGPDG